MEERDNEYWAEVPGFPDYIVSTYGKLYNQRLNRRIYGNLADNGCIRIDLYNGVDVSVPKPSTLHGAVASAFLPDYKPRLPIIHLDGDRTNNRVSNLSMGLPPTRRFDILESSYKRGKEVIIVDTEEVYPSVPALADALGAPPSSIYKVLNGERGRYRGLKFEYLDKYNKRKEF